MIAVKQGHPRGLYVLFLAEMWERCSYYGMRGLLVLYMTQYLFKMGDNFSYAIYGSYTALVYATPILGGYLADRYLGYRKSVIFGGILMVIGHFAMAVENHQIFFLALAFIIVGNGFFKPNISTIVGALYETGDRRRDAGFTIFYMGINVGSFLQLIAGYLGKSPEWGWHWGFGFAGLGMVFGLIVFWLGQGRLDGHAEPPKPKELEKKVLPGLNIEWAIYLGGTLLVFLCWQMVQSDLVGKVLGFFGLLIFGFLVWYAVTRCTQEERNKMFAALILIVVSMFFWAFFEQAGSSINMFTERNVDRTMFGTEIATPIFQSVNPGFIVLLAPLFSLLWIRLAQKDMEPSTPVKFGLGIIILGLGFGSLWWGAQNGENGLAAMRWLILGYFLHTVGELCVSPIGLSMITKLSPKRITALMMGTWFLGTALAQYVAGLIAMLTGGAGEHVSEGGQVDASQSILVYGEVFGQIALVAFGVGIGMLIISPLVKKLMQEVN